MAGQLPLPPCPGGGAGASLRSIVLNGWRAFKLRPGSHTCLHSHLPGSGRWGGVAPDPRSKLWSPRPLNYKLTEGGSRSPLQEEATRYSCCHSRGENLTLSHDPWACQLPCPLAARAGALPLGACRLALWFMAAALQEGHQAV